MSEIASNTLLEDYLETCLVSHELGTIDWDYEHLRFWIKPFRQHPLSYLIMHYSKLSLDVRLRVSRFQSRLRDLSNKSVHGKKFSVLSVDVVHDKLHGSVILEKAT